MNLEKLMNFTFKHDFWIIVMHYFHVFKYDIAAVLILILCSFLKDKNEIGEGILGKQRWNIHDALVGFFLLAIIRALYSIFYEFFNFKLALFVYSISAIVFIFLLFKFRLKQNYYVLGISRINFLPNFFYGLKIILIYEIIFFGFLLIQSAPEKYLIQMGAFYKEYTNESKVLLLISVFLVGPDYRRIFFQRFNVFPSKKKSWSMVGYYFDLNYLWPYP